MRNIESSNLYYNTGYYILKVSKEKKNDIKNILNNHKIDCFGIGDNYTSNSNVVLYLELDTKLKVKSIMDLINDGGLKLKLTKEIQEKNENIEPFALS